MTNVFLAPSTVQQIALQQTTKVVTSKGRGVMYGASSLLAVYYGQSMYWSLDPLELMAH